MPKFYETNQLSMIPKRHLFFDIGSGTDSFTLQDDETGVILEADEGDGFFTLDGSTPSETKGLTLNATNVPQRYDLFPGITVNLKGRSSNTTVNALTFRTTGKGGTV